MARQLREVVEVDMGENPNGASEEGPFPLDADSVRFECTERSQNKVDVRVYWNYNGPEELRGKLALDAGFTIFDKEAKLLLKVEPGVEVDSDFVKYLCAAYAVWGFVQPFQIRRADVHPMEAVKVK